MAARFPVVNEQIEPGLTEILADGQRDYPPTGSLKDPALTSMPDDGWGYSEPF